LEIFEVQGMYFSWMRPSSHSTTCLICKLWLRHCIGDSIVTLLLTIYDRQRQCYNEI
jgi:hypothetical protein